MAKWGTSKKILIWGSISVVSLIALGFIIWNRTPFKQRLVNVANGEWALFGYQTINKEGKTERRGRKENDHQNIKKSQIFEVCPKKLNFLFPINSHKGFFCLI